MVTPDFTRKLATELKADLGEHFEVVTDYSAEPKEEIHDLAILEDGHLRIIFELEAGDVEAVKPEMRKFYENKAGDTNFVLGIANTDELVIFDADNELLDREYEEGVVEEISKDVKGFLQR